jgi:hypothetical protein
MQDLQESIEPLLYEHGVQLAFTGHHHSVQRQSAVYRNVVVQNSTVVADKDGNLVATHVNAGAPVWVVVGTAGTKLFGHVGEDCRIDGGDYLHECSTGQEFDQPTRIYSWSEISLTQVFGYAIIEAVNASYLYYEWINSANDVVQDRMALIQSFNNKSAVVNYEIVPMPAATVEFVIVVAIVVALAFLWLFVQKRSSTAIAVASAATASASSMERGESLGNVAHTGGANINQSRASGMIGSRIQHLFGAKALIKSH